MRLSKYDAGGWQETRYQQMLALYVHVPGAEVSGVYTIYLVIDWPVPYVESTISLKLPHVGINSTELGGWPLKVFDNVIRNLLDSWLDSKIPDFILEIPVHQIRKHISRD